MSLLVLYYIFFYIGKLITMYVISLKSYLEVTPTVCGGSTVEIFGEKIS